MTYTQPRHSFHNRQGFALVVSLVLMGFVLMLTLALQLSLGVELKITENDKNKELARQNALLALNVAIGELQKQIGPDRRATARADIHDATPDDPYDSPGVQHPYWTGVWNPDGTLRTWLVSGNNNGSSTPQYSAINSTLSSNNSRELVSESSPGASDTVRAPLVELPRLGGHTGAYAYWVSDEGIKAKINLPNASPFGMTNTSLRLPEVHGVNQLAQLSWLPIQERDLLERLSRPTQLDIIEVEWNNGSPSNIHEHFHDLTFYSYGLPANMRDGGLRLDLTNGLSQTASEPTGQIFGPISNRPGQGTTYTTDIDPGGPTWEQLRSWANTSGLNGLNVSAATDTEVGFSPIISAFELYLVPTYEPSSHEVSIHLMPAISLWNPYNHPLQLNSYVIYLGDSRHTTSGFLHLGNPLEGWYLQLQLSGGGYETNTSNAELVTANLGTNPLIFNIPNITLAPGEVRVFSPPDNAPYQDALNTELNELAPGYPVGGSFYLPAGLPGAPRSLDSDGSGTPIDGYRFSLSDLPTLTLQLCLRDTSGQIIPLSEMLYLNAHNQNLTLAPSVMTEFIPSAPTLLSSVERQDAIGLKITRNFVDNKLSNLPQTRLKWLAQNNPRASTQGPLPLYYQSSLDYHISNSSNNPSFITSLETHGFSQGSGLEGVGYSESGLVTYTTLYEVPESLDRIFSIGELMHAPLYLWNDDTTASYSNRIRDRNDYSRFDNLIPAYAIGNSLADPTIPLDAVYRNWASYANTNNTSLYSFRGLHYDYSYLLNEALWDAYFFSTWPNSSPNPEHPRLIPTRAAATPGYRESAAQLMIDGAFNINSTSIAAWKAFLSSFLGEDVQLANGSSDSDSNRAPYLRMRSPVSSAADGSYSDSTTYTGYAYLDNSSQQIERLAEEIVRQIKLRGPFTSLSDFVNRSLTDKPSTDQDERLRGALAEAILQADINNRLQTSTDIEAVPLPSQLGGYNADAAEGWLTENTPGWLSQADLLARLGSVISARSDTFLVRVYGEIRNPITGAVDAQAWGEAILQREADYVDSVNPATTPFDPDTALAAGYSPLNAANQAMGRRISLVSFRWLNQNEL